MNDRFKFKWFDNKINFMAEVIYFCLESGDAMVRYSYAHSETPDEEVSLKDGVLIQCTGLRDKNGKLIFEGDVCFVKRPNTFFSKGENFIVEYNKENHAFMYKYKRCGEWNWAFSRNGHYLIGRNRGKSTVCEIVGNRFENPKLLINDEENYE